MTKSELGLVLATARRRSGKTQAELARAMGKAAREHAPVEVPFPVHNFFLLGVRNLLWIFRLVGIWWIWQGISSFF